MKVAYLKAPNQIEFRDESALKAGINQIVVKVAACGICGTDIHAAHQNEIFLPFGHEIAGKIAEIGEGVDRLQMEQDIVLDSATPCGRCNHCRNGKQELCTDIKSFYFNNSFGMAEYILAPAISAFPYDGLLPAEATLSEPLGVALDLVRIADIKPGHNVLIMGPGPIGLMALRLIKKAGAEKIFVSGLSGTIKRNKIALEFGADAMIEVDRQPLEEYAFNCPIDRIVSTSPPFTLPSAMRVASKGAIIAFIGFAGDSDPDITFNVNEFHIKKLQLRASFASPALMGPMAIEILKKDTIIREKLISHIFKFNELQSAMDVAVNGTAEALKVVVVS
jgi:threonine dehydrogenase-like Zn-dependent dehydrogenase